MTRILDLEIGDADVTASGIGEGILCGVPDDFPLQVDAWSPEQFRAVVEARARLGHILDEDELRAALGLVVRPNDGDDLRSGAGRTSTGGSVICRP